MPRRPYRSTCGFKERALSINHAEMEAALKTALRASGDPQIDWKKRGMASRRRLARIREIEDEIEREESQI